MSMAEPEDFRDDKQRMLLAESHVHLQLYGCYGNYYGNDDNIYIYISM